ncbi:cytochrome P450 CYP82D47-like [Ipomoea triloba]|uniref:cytochrome P450 CYP82D47-like n=1 Tax=Ipomoea triloba TaxID=35885 RepID=UPI00125CE631|nr:cytochrome P450 CYP82D47-like [Ipomoea triloba]
MDLLAHSVAWLLVFVLLSTLRKKSQRSSNNNGQLPPEVPGAWPIIGHMHLLLADQIPLQRILAAIADKLGPIFTLRLGMHRTVVITDRKALRDCFTTYDKALAGRPESSAGEILGYNNAGFGFVSYGPYWRRIRKIVLSELLSCRRLEKFGDARAAEVEASIGELYSTVTGEGRRNRRNNSPVMINVGNWIEKLALNLMVKMIAGKRYRTTDDWEDDDDEAKRSRKAIVEFLTSSGQSVVSDVIPIPLLRWIDIGGSIKSMKRIAAEMDAIISGWIDEHAERISISESDRDFIDVLLSSVTDDLLEYGHAKDTIIKATIATIIVAGSDSPSLTLTWALSLLINNKDALERAREEIDTIVGVERWVQESDIKNLIYLQAIIKETLRLYPPAPLAVPHAATEDCAAVAGYRIHKGTRVILNLWKLHRDPEVWAGAEEFRPDRFLPGGGASEVDFLGQHFEYIPFGSGRRICPGIGFATQVCHLVLGRLIQGFEFGAPPCAAVDMAEGVSFSLPRAKPLEVLVAPRLASALYEQKRIAS